MNGHYTILVPLFFLHPPSGGSSTEQRRNSSADIIWVCSPAFTLPARGKAQKTGTAWLQTAETVTCLVPGTTSRTHQLQVDGIVETNISWWNGVGGARKKKMELSIFI